MRLPILLVLTALLAFGCSRNNPGKNGSGIPDIQVPQDESQAEGAAKPAVPPPHVIFLVPVELGDDCEKNEENLVFAQTLLKTVYNKILLSPRNAAILTLDEGNAEKYQETGRRVHKIEFFITKIDRGNGFLRYVIGFGLGPVVFRVQGRVVDFKTGDFMMLFATIEQSAGEPNMGMDARVLSSDHCLRLAAERFAERLVENLKGYL